MGIKTRITEKFGIDTPIIMGGMTGVGYGPLVAAVANSGALGFITAHMYPSGQALFDEIEATRRLTDKPFGVNLTLLPSINPIPYDDYREAIIASGIKIVETAGRAPTDHLPRFKDGDVIPATVDALPDTPIIASGGMADGRSLIAALALGADAVNMGTRFCATVEAQIHNNVKQRIVDASELDTVLVGRTLRNTARVARNAVSLEVAEIQRDPTKTFDDVRHLMAGVRGRENVLRDGDVDGGIWTSGQSQALIHDIPTCAELVQNIMAQAEAVRDRLRSS